MHKLNKKLKENLYSEIHILKGLHHPHIVALIDCQETAAHIHLVMEFCQLGDLSYFIKKRDTLSRHEATKEMIEKYPNPVPGGLNEVIVRHFLKQLASALEFLRNRNFIHRDVKPQNLLLDPSPLFYAKAKPEAVPYAAHEKSLIPMVGIPSLPTLKIADFGFARSLPSTSLAETLCGSPLYMAPEILRYEKYDAKADLWSVGTVLYEMMVGKPPFRASNHVELLRKIERGEDKLRFPEDALLSDSMKKLIRGLLKRGPVERMSFRDFFNNTVVKDPIPGLVGDDRPIGGPKPETGPGIAAEGAETTPVAVLQGDLDVGGAGAPNHDTTQILSQSPQSMDVSDPPRNETRNDAVPKRRLSATPPRMIVDNARGLGHRHESSASAAPDAHERGVQAHRPSIATHATAPARQDLHVGSRNAAATNSQRQPSRNTPSPSSLGVTDRWQSHVKLSKDETAAREATEARERAAQDVAFERDYVLVEKRAVEVNAFADELAASPRIHGAGQLRPDSNRGVIVRRATTQGPLNSTTGTQMTPSRAIQLASGKRVDQMHHRQSSYERRLRDPTSATSAISKAINMASGRLFNIGFSPPLSVARGAPSPPSYNPFPAYPTNKGSIVMIGDGSKGSMPSDEDTRAVYVIEESATRSDVVYGFAEVKYKQLIPFAPSIDQGLGLRQAGMLERAEVDTSTSEDEGLTADAIVTLSEEALVLYVKALSLLARSMDIAGAWWARKNRGEIVEDIVSPRTQPNPAPGVAVGNRVNNVVQWVRSRFNEVLEKAEFVRLKLIDGQKQLPLDHPSHPNNHPTASNSSSGMKSSVDNVIVSSGVTAEKLMFDRALEMSRSAAVNELIGDDLPGCEIAYVTAIRMLEAVLESDDEPIARKPQPGSRESEDDAINGVEAEDRKVVLKRKSKHRVHLASYMVLIFPSGS
jgi:serine/threonine-protein kinase ULK2